MALDQTINFGLVEVSTGYDAAATSIVLATDEGAKLPDPGSGQYNVTWWDSTLYPNPADDPNVEIVRVTAKSTDTLTVSRNQESSGASTKNTVDSTYKMMLGVTKKTIDDIETDLNTRVDTSGTPVANDFAKFSDGDTIAGRSYAETRSDLNVADGADVTGDNAPQAHKDSHDPEDGSDPLDTAAPANIDGVQAAAVGTSHSLARADHDHRIQHSIADNAIATIDDADAADNDYAKFTADGLEGRSYSEVKTDLSLNNVENTAISSWAGSGNITTVGTLSSGDATSVVSQASAVGAGKIEIATNTETLTGTDTARAVTPDDLAYMGSLTGWTPEATTPTFATSTTFTLASVDRTERYTKGTKVKTTWTGGSQTKALDLELSSSQYASIADASQTGLDITGDFTIEAWINIEQLPSTAGTAFSIAAKYRGTGTSRCYRFKLHSTDELVCTYSQDGDVVNYTQAVSNVVADSSWIGVWKHVAVAVDVSAQTITFYVDGVAQTTTYNNQGATSIHDNSSIPFILGAEGNGSTNGSYFDGIISEVRVWNDIRTADEVRSNMYHNVSAAAAGLAGYWKLDDDYLDETSNDNDLTASGSPTFTTDVPEELTNGEATFYVVSSSFSTDTTVTVTGEKWLQDTTLAGFYSYADNPKGFKRGEDWYRARVGVGTQMSNLTSGSETTIELDTEEYDTNGDFNTSAYTYVAPIAGKYLATGQVSYASVVADKAYYAKIAVDGSVQVANLQHASLAERIMPTATAELDLEKGQQVTFLGQQDSGVNTVDVDDLTRLTGFQIQFVGL